MPKKDVTINELAAMVKEGFDDVAHGMNKRFDNLEERMDVMEKSHDEIKLRLDNVAYRFEIVELQRRVELLEKKFVKSRFLAR